ncbi:MAG: hypothetical protein KDA63_08050, partial [Planctomycetales bacterium]|nr:hypothetical protein [Planctomycetales bacterium]
MSATTISGKSIGGDGRADANRTLWLVSVLLLVTLAAAYLPDVFSGCFVDDDWKVAYRPATAPGYWDTFRSWFPLFSNRPLAPVLLSLTANTFGGRAAGYIAVHLALWCAALVTVCAV